MASGSIEVAMFWRVEMIRRVLAGGLVVLSCTLLFAAEPNERFRRLDRNQDGKLSKDEFDRPSFDKVDANKDGAISPEEQEKFNTRRAGRNRTRGEKQEIPQTVKAQLDVPYAATDNPRQRLDLYLPVKPSSDKPLPAVVYIHGGGWHKGDKAGGYRKLGSLVETGEYVGVSVGYRLSHEAIWPAQIHDCKAAIRWLRANAAKYNIDPDRIGVVGTSAGGHLVAMLGTSGDVSALEGSLGEHTKVSSRVACVVDFFGPSDLLSLGDLHNTAKSPCADLLGGPIPEKKDLAREASPVTYVSKDDPPFLMIHGTNDALVPFQQSEVLKAALEKEQVSALLIPVTRGGHGVSGLEATARMTQFFDKHLLGKDVTVNVEPIKSIK